MDNILPKDVYLKRIYKIKQDNIVVFVYSDGTALAYPMEFDFDVITI